MRWRILALLFLARVGLGFQFQTMGSVSAEISGIFGLDNARIGLMIGLFMAPGLVLVLPAGVLGRFAPDRILTGLGFGGLALGGLVSALAPSAEIIGIGRMLAGAGSVMAMLYLSKMVVDWFDGREIATAMSIFVTSWPLGIAMGQVGHAFLLEMIGWRAPFMVASLYCALAALVILAFYRPPHDLPSHGAARAKGLLPVEWSLVILAGFAWGVFNAGYIVYLSFGPATLEAQGMGSLAAASVISLGSWVMMGSGAACGLIVDRFGRRDLVLLICMASAAVALLLLRIPDAGLAASLIFGLIGMAPAGVIMALAGQAVAPERRAFGMGVFFTVYYAALTAAPPMAGWVVDRAGEPGAAILFGAVLFVLVVPATLLFRATRQRAFGMP
ncbi:MFS transporter [Roseibacterium sp. SDUM158016]|uniref:MFS transporter n=1 Tax=Roseicyclus sediminis TaxID=2980997 RepID=UPI0021D322CC|nr:MFS transporter [Roseibacterium sp. SDUM158016]MCU4652731.1 MFS transporter [Roseibacterium sp. SDUM158016]